MSITCGTFRLKPGSTHKLRKFDVCANCGEIRGKHASDRLPVEDKENSMGDNTSKIRLIAERIIQNLEQMSLPVTAHGEREAMIQEVQGVLNTMLAEYGFVRLQKPSEA